MNPVMMTPNMSYVRFGGGKPKSYASITLPEAQALLKQATDIPEYQENEAKINRAVNEVKKVLEQAPPEVFGPFAAEVLGYECGWNPADGLIALANRRAEADPEANQAYDAACRKLYPDCY